MDEMKVLMVIAHEGFQHIEYHMPKKIIEQAGFKVVTASDRSGTALAKNGSRAEVDLTLEKVRTDGYAGIIFVGGPGALEHLDNNISYKIIQSAFHQNIPIGAICIATRIIAYAGILQSKEATGWNDDNQLETIYKKCQCTYIADKPVVVDDNIVTAIGPTAATEFAQEFVSILIKKQSWG
jgi:putative intracellular protease/amidase